MGPRAIPYFLIVRLQKRFNLRRAEQRAGLSRHVLMDAEAVDGDDLSHTLHHFYTGVWVSGIERIGKDYYEAASIDGANKVGQLLYITLPLLKGIFRTNVIMWSISVSGFFIWSKLFSPISADTSTIVPMVYMYDKLFGAENTGDVVRDAGTAAAIGVMLCLFIVLVFTVVNRLIKDDDLEF